MRPAGRVALAALLLTLTWTRLAAQTAGVLLTEGVRAYRDLQFDAALQLLRRALDVAGPRPLSSTDRARALMYVGASHVFRDDRDQAVAAFRALVLADARFRPSALVFPPRVTELFTEVLQTTKAVALVAPPEARLRAGAAPLAVRAFVTSRHRIDARVVSADGAVVASLFRGTLTDSVTLSWDGLDSSGTAVPGRYSLVVASMLAEDQVLRTVRLPLDVRVERRDTLPWPRQPAGRASGWDAPFLVPGLALGIGLVLPAVLDSRGAKGERITFGLAFGTIGVVGGHRGGSATGDASWRRRLAAVQQENARRRGLREIRIQTGPLERTEGSER